MRRCFECGKFLQPEERGLCEWCDKALGGDLLEGHTNGEGTPPEETEGDLPDLCPDYC